MAFQQNIIIEQDADFKARITTDTDLTGYVGYSEVRETFGGALLGTFVVTTNGTAMTVDLFMDSPQTAAIAAGEYRYDVVLFNSSTGDRQRIQEGVCTVTPRVTQL